MSVVFLGIIRCLLRATPPFGLGAAGGQFVYTGLLALVDAALSVMRTGGKRVDP